MNVMVVDDNAFVRSMVINILSLPDSRFYECTNGEEAIKCFAKNKPDLVLMDIEMNKIDGITAAKEILRDFPGANIIILTQYDDNFLRDAAFKSGVKGYFLKDNLVLLRGFINQQISSKKINLKQR